MNHRPFSNNHDHSDPPTPLPPLPLPLPLPLPPTHPLHIPDSLLPHDPPFLFLFLPIPPPLIGGERSKQSFDSQLFNKHVLMILEWCMESHILSRARPSIPSIVEYYQRPKFKIKHSLSFEAVSCSTGLILPHSFAHVSVFRVRPHHHHSFGFSSFSRYGCQLNTIGMN